jgi:hypothetical protein
MKNVNYLVRALILVVVFADRYQFYTQYPPEKHLLNVAFNRNRPLSDLIIYDSIIGLITLIGVFLFYPICSLGLIFDSCIKVFDIKNHGFETFKERFEERSVGILFAVALIILLQILLFFLDKGDSGKKLKNVNEDQRRNPRDSNNSNNLSKRRNQKDSMF